MEQEDNAVPGSIVPAPRTPWLSLRHVAMAVALLLLAVPLTAALQRPRLSADVLDEARDDHERTWRRAAQVYARFSKSRDVLHRPAQLASPRPAGTQRLELQAEAEACRERIETALTAPELPGAPKLEKNRALVLARGKAEPVLFTQEPQFRGEVTKGMAAHRMRITQTLFPRDVVLQLIKQFRHYPEHLRALFLRDGYFYTDDDSVAREITVRLGFEDLFDEERLVMMRGSRTSTLQRKEGVYYFATGPYVGERARLLLFDRVWIEGQDPGPPLHVDVRELAHREGFAKMRVERIGEDYLIAWLEFSGEWVRAFIQRDQTNLSLGCLLVEPDDAARIGRARDEAAHRTAVMRALRDAITLQVKEALPFDEPRTEHGQQDGKLRPRWEHAYLNGRTQYRFNGDSYRVFNDTGFPSNPQVCIDFITESLERASGMYWARQGQRPHKVHGAIDFDTLLNGYRRQEMALRNYARENPERIDLYDYPMEEWERYENVSRFFKFLEREKDEFQPGDIVVIRGRARWDHYREIHTHTFFIYEADPVTGMPTLLAGNSGKPRIVTWDGEMLRAPKRSVRHRMHLSTEWLYDNFQIKEQRTSERLAPPLTVIER